MTKSSVRARRRPVTQRLPGPTGPVGPCTGERRPGGRSRVPDAAAIPVGLLRRGCGRARGGRCARARRHICPFRPVRPVVDAGGAVAGRWRATRRAKKVAGAYLSPPSPHPSRPEVAQSRHCPDAQEPARTRKSRASHLFPPRPPRLPRRRPRTATAEVAEGPDRAQAVNRPRPGRGRGGRWPGSPREPPRRAVCYASSRLLRSFALRCTRKRGVAEGEGAK